jgi:phage tail sheath gpL-like
VRVERAITTYQKNLWDQSDTAIWTAKTLHTLAYLLRNLRYRITQKYPRPKLANDGTRIGAGQATSPKVIRRRAGGRVCRDGGQRHRRERRLFAQNLIVERDSSNPNR